MNTWKRIGIMLTLLAVLFLMNTLAVYAETEIRFDVKTPQEYTLQEYEALTPQQQDEFYLWFDSIEAFEAWRAEAAPPMPWEAENRNPDDYTWEEYSGFTYAQQDAFVASFETVEAFESWLECVQPDCVVLLPWDQSEKLPVDYTWAEYEELTTTQKDAFIAWFSDEADFEAWMKSSGGEAANSAALPWEQSGKCPADYTWPEFEALTIPQQDAFIEWFGNVLDFEAWMEVVRAQSDAPGAMPWEEAGKSPVDYTWAEFERLTVDQQNVFIERFGSPESFEEWMEAVHPELSNEAVIPWVNDKRQPDVYTASEFEALTPYQQGRFLAWFDTEDALAKWLDSVYMIDLEAEQPKEAEHAAELNKGAWTKYEKMTSVQRILFFMGFGSANDFLQWVEAAKPDDILDVPMPWDNTKKQPAEYTWEEYEALPVQLQDAFFAWFESAELFEAWMKEKADRAVLSELGVYEHAPITRVIEPEDVDTIFLMDSEPDEEVFGDE